MSPQTPEGPHADESVPPHADVVDKLVQSHAAEVDEAVPPQVFGICSIEFSLLPLYPDHTSRHIWDAEVKLVGLILFKLVYYYIISF